MLAASPAASWDCRCGPCSVQRLRDGTNRTLHAKYCSAERPETRRPCSRLPCPAQWRTGAWSQCSASCGDGVQQRQVVCRGEESGGRCHGDKPEAIRGCHVAVCLGKPSGITASANASDHVTPGGQWETQERPQNPVSKISSREPCLGDKSIFCQMEVLARYCSIPGYNKLCCESCGKKASVTASPTDIPTGTPVGTPSPTAPSSSVQGTPGTDPTTATPREVPAPSESSVGTEGEGGGQAAR